MNFLLNDVLRSGKFVVYALDCISPDTRFGYGIECILWNLFTIEGSFLGYGGVIGFLICSTEGPHVDFANPINPIEKLDGADKHKRELRFYNSEVKAPHFKSSFPWSLLLDSFS